MAPGGVALTSGAPPRIWLCTSPTDDMWRSLDGLSAQVRNVLGENPTSGYWFVFVNRRRTMLHLQAGADRKHMVAPSALAHRLSALAIEEVHSFEIGVEPYARPDRRAERAAEADRDLFSARQRRDQHYLRAEGFNRDDFGIEGRGAGSVYRSSGRIPNVAAESR